MDHCLECCAYGTTGKPSTCDVNALCALASQARQLNVVTYRYQSDASDAPGYSYLGKAIRTRRVPNGLRPQLHPHASTCRKHACLLFATSSDDRCRSMHTCACEPQQHTELRFAAQGLPRRALKHLLRHTVDLDIKNSVFVLVHQLLQKLECSMFPPDMMSVIERCALHRESACRPYSGVSLPPRRVFVSIRSFSGCQTLCSDGWNLRHQACR